MIQVTLNDEEMEILFRQDPLTAQGGGFQSFLVKLQRKTNRQTGALTLDEDDLEKIPRYAFDYQTGGWEGRLMSIFKRHLGSQLGRQ